MTDETLEQRARLEAWIEYSTTDRGVDPYRNAPALTIQSDMSAILAELWRKEDDCRRSPPASTSNPPTTLP